MHITIRPVQPDHDDPAIAALWSLENDTPITAVTLKQWFSPPFAPDYSLYRAVMVDSDAHDRVIGHALVEHETYFEQGRFRLFVNIDSAYRRQGFGTRLYNHALEQAQTMGATCFYGTVREQDALSLAFAQKRGFVIDRHSFGSVIDLKAFNPASFSGVVERVEATGIRFFTLADVGDTVEERRKLYEVNHQLVLDDPGSAGGFITFDEFNHNFNTAAWYRPAGQFLAADGDIYIGLSAVGYFAETNSMYNLMTGVLAPYRGRGIAQALKLLTIRYAQAFGADSISTHNDSQNTPMLAINRKLGYRPQPGRYRMAKA